MHITEQIIDDVTVVRLVGTLDAMTAPIVDTPLHSLTAAGAVRLVLDLSELSYLDSAGIRVLFTTIREARRQSGNLRLAGVQPPVARIKPRHVRLCWVSQPTSAFRAAGCGARRANCPRARRRSPNVSFHNHAITRTALIATAVTTCCNCVRASPI